MNPEKNAADNVSEYAPRPRRRVYKRYKKQPDLAAPGQAAMFRESTRRRLENPLQEPSLALQDSLSELRAIRKYRARQFAGIQTHLGRLQRGLFKLSSDSYERFHELVPEVPQKSKKRKRDEVDKEADEDVEEEEEEDAIPRKRQRTRAQKNTEVRILRTIRLLAEETKFLKDAISGMEVDHERQVQRQMRDRLEDLRERMQKRDRDHDKMVAGWGSVRLSKEARTFVAAHVRHVPGFIQWSPMTAFDPPVDHEQASEAAAKRRKSLTVANFLQEKHGKRAATTATHPAKTLGKDKRVRRLLPKVEFSGPLVPIKADPGGFDMSDHSAND